MKRAIKRFKIVEQIIIVLLLAVIVPSIISGIIINNVNQHAVRNELQSSAIMISEVVNKNISTFITQNKNQLNEVILAIKYIPSEYYRNVYLKDIMVNLSDFKALEIINKQETQPKQNKEISFSKKEQEFIVTEKINDKEYLRAKIPLKMFHSSIFDTFKQETRQIYILTTDRRLLSSFNYNESDFQNTLESMPKVLRDGVATVFGGIKNQPLVYYKMHNYPVIILVNTTHKVTNTTINTARAKIILSVVITSSAIIFLVGLYTYYLYINMRQLFKAVIALSKGNYTRKIRLLANVLTPYEILFLAQEFNKMVYEINISYRKLKTQNRQLKELDNIRETLIDTVSHELRTPLTSIKGYTSRLLRTDIKIDEETQTKSLKIIKRQTERLTRMVEDLLVIPDIERSNLNIQLEMVGISDILDSAIASVRENENNDIKISISPKISAILADKDRIEQVMINLLENANKYAFSGSTIKIKVTKCENDISIKVTNEAAYIPEDKLNKLIEKFSRIDDKTTRTTRGTGLGLFIVNGLIKAMGGSFKLTSTKDNTFTAEITLKGA